MWWTICKLLRDIYIEITMIHCVFFLIFINPNAYLCIYQIKKEWKMIQQQVNNKINQTINQ